MNKNRSLRFHQCNLQHNTHSDYTNVDDAGDADVSGINDITIECNQSNLFSINSAIHLGNQRNP